MFDKIVGNEYLQLITHSDLLTKIILVIFLLALALNMAIWIQKWFMLRKKHKEMDHALKYLKKVHSVDDIKTMSVAFSHTLPGKLVHKSFTFLKILLEKKDEKELLNEHEIELFQQRFEQRIAETIYKVESNVSILSMSAAVAPLVGLFGTVWGLINAFIRIGQTQQADIATIAPGISEALITTFLGLIVAIPCLLLYHHLASLVRNLENQLYSFEDRLTWIVQSLFLKR